MEYLSKTFLRFFFFFFTYANKKITRRRKCLCYLSTSLSVSKANTGSTGGKATGPRREVVGKAVVKAAGGGGGLPELFQIKEHVITHLG